MNSTPENLPDPEPAEASDSDQTVSSAASSLPDGRSAESPPNLVQLGEERDPELVSETSSPMELVAWGLQRFADQKIVITTSFGMEGCTLIDMCSKAVAADTSERTDQINGGVDRHRILLSGNACTPRKTGSQIRQHPICSLVHRSQRRRASRNIRQRVVEK